MLIKSFLSAERIVPPKGKVLLEALYAETTFGPLGTLELEIPVEHQRRYSHLARVLRGGEEEGLRPGDMVILEDEGVEIDRTYYDVFKLILNDDGKEVVVVVDNELEPALREKILAYQANRTTEDVQVSVQDVNDDQWWTFNCSDVVDWTWDFQPNKAHRYEYVPVFMIEILDQSSGRFKTHYIADLKVILATLREEDDNEHDSAGSDQDRRSPAQGDGHAGLQGAHHDASAVDQEVRPAQSHHVERGRQLTRGGLLPTHGSCHPGKQ